MTGKITSVFAKEKYLELDFDCSLRASHYEEHTFFSLNFSGN